MINQTFSHTAAFASQAASQVSQIASQALQSLNTTQFSRLSQVSPLSKTALLAVAGGALVLGMGAVAASRYLYSAKSAPAASTTPTPPTLETASVADEDASVGQASTSSEASLASISSPSSFVIANQAEPEKAHQNIAPTESTPPSVKSLIAKFEGIIDSNQKAKQTPPKNENIKLNPQSAEFVAKVDFFTAFFSANHARSV